MVLVVIYIRMRLLSISKSFDNGKIKEYTSYLTTNVNYQVSFLQVYLSLSVYQSVNMYLYLYIYICIYRHIHLYVCVLCLNEFSYK